MNSERKVVANLNRQGFDVYFPRYLKRRSHAGKVEMVAAALFPRYVFVAIDLAHQPWRVIRSTIGVVQLVCHGERPAPLAADVITDLRKREDDRGLVQLDRAIFREGEKVRVIGGAFYDHLGIFDSASDSQRVSVLLDLLGRKVRVVMNSNVIEAA